MINILSKNIVGVLVPFYLVTSCVGGMHVLSAKEAQFKPGDKVKLSMSEEVDFPYQIGFDEHSDHYSLIDRNTDTTLEVEMKIVSSHPETLSYPLEVEVKVIRLTIYADNGAASDTISYDSRNPTSLSNFILGEALLPLFYFPLRFQVDGPFQIKEMTGYLAQVEENCSTMQTVTFLRSPRWTLALMLTRFFQEQDLFPGRGKMSIKQRWEMESDPYAYAN
jgi:hypothetical protein